MVYGFIGLGNMASAILRGMAASGAFADDTLCGFNRSEGKTLALWHEIGLVPCESAVAVAQMADVVVLAVKPQMLPEVLPLVTPEITKDKLLVTIAAGKPTTYYEAQLPEGVGVVRVMPNINARVHAAASAVCGGKYATEEQLAIVREMFSAPPSAQCMTLPSPCSPPSPRSAAPPVRSCTSISTRSPPRA